MIDDNLKYCFVFVCQEGELEIKSSLLAASLNFFLRCSYELVVVVPIPEYKWGSPNRETLTFLASLGVKVQERKNEISYDYPIGNKISCFGVETNADKVIFLDSDMLLLNKFEHHDRFKKHINVKPADLVTFSSDHETWKKVYKLFNLSLPNFTLTSTVSLEAMSPYFNAGFIGVNSDLKFFETWVDVCKKIDAEKDIPKKRPFLDQIALPVVISLLNLEYDILDESYNFPAHLRTIESSNLPLICHYHWLSVIKREPVLLEAIANLIAVYPQLKNILKRHNDWVTVAA